MCKVINDEITVSRKKSFCQAKNAGVIVEKLMPGNALQGCERNKF
jgi:hypothetical protein